MVGSCRGRFHVQDFVQYFLLFMAGFLLRTLQDMMSLGSLPEPCPPCVIQLDQEEILNHDVHLQLRESYKPKTMYEVFRYDYFNLSHILNNFDDNPKTSLLGHQKNDIRDVLHQGMVLYNAGTNIRWKINKLINGYRRYDPLRGEEYLLDLILEPEEDESSMPERVRLEIVKPFGSAQLVSKRKREHNVIIHIILPVTANNPRLDIFLRNFEQLSKSSEDDLYLMLVLFVNQSAGYQKRLATIKETTISITRRHHNAHISTVQTRKAFSRTLGIELGVKQLPQGCLMFFCDVDIVVSPSFLLRCKQNAVLSKQVYYPMVYAQYNPEITRKYSTEVQYQHLLQINKHTGQWVHYGYGMACMYAADYRSVGGLDLQISGWGGEDVDLYKKHVLSPLKVMRAADPGLIHVYHEKSCSHQLTSDQLRMCVDSRSEMQGSRQQLGKALRDCTET